MSSRISKTARQHRITKLLEENQVTNQTQLVELLAEAGVEVNQATVSRDLEELSAVKVRVPGGETAYAIPELPFDQVSTDDHLRRVLGDWVAGLDRSGDLVVLRTPPGCAHVVASAIDRSGTPTSSYRHRRRHPRVSRRRARRRGRAAISAGPHSTIKKDPSPWQESRTRVLGGLDTSVRFGG